MSDSRLADLLPSFCGKPFCSRHAEPDSRYCCIHQDWENSP
jgi:hypothetical protein